MCFSLQRIRWMCICCAVSSSDCTSWRLRELCSPIRTNSDRSFLRRPWGTSAPILQVRSHPWSHYKFQNLSMHCFTQSCLFSSVCNIISMLCHHKKVVQLHLFTALNYFACVFVFRGSGRVVSWCRRFVSWGSSTSSHPPPAAAVSIHSTFTHQSHIPPPGVRGQRPI